MAFPEVGKFTRVDWYTKSHGIVVDYEPDRFTKRCAQSTRLRLRYTSGYTRYDLISEEYIPTGGFAPTLTYIHGIRKLITNHEYLYSFIEIVV